MALPANYTFDGTGNLADTADWNQSTGEGNDIVLSGGVAIGDSGGGSGEACCYWASDTPDANMYVEADVVHNGAAFSYAGVSLRDNMSGTFYTFRIDRAQPIMHIARVNAGTPTVLVSTATGVANGRLRFEANGSTLTAFLNGTQVLQTTDANLASGGGGVSMRNSSNQNSLDNFVIGNLTAAVIDTYYYQNNQ